MPSTHRFARLAAGLAAGLTVAAFLVVGATPAAALTPTTFLACGYADTPGATTLAATGCTTLPVAIKAAEVLSSKKTARIDLLPGLYCPIDIPAGTDSLTFQGAGYAGLDPTAGAPTYSGPEAGLTSFVYDGAHCGSTPAAMIQAPAGYAGTAELRFINLAVDGTSGPADGIDLSDVLVGLRDVIVENASSTGLAYDGGNADLTIDNSAIINNGVGLDLTGDVSLSESTVADNTTGIDATASALSLINDTITANGTGVTLAGSSNTTEVRNTIVGDNSTADCAGDVGSGGDWEYSFSQGGSAGGSFNNLTGPTCVPSAADGTDIALSDSISNSLLATGPTPSIDPPTQAQDAADPGTCEPTGSDQREDVFDQETSCDIGSVQHDAPPTTVAHASASTLDFGSVADGDSATKTVTISNSGSGLLGIASVTTSPAGVFTVPAANNGCGYDVLTSEDGATTCTVTVAVTPKAAGRASATLIVHTTASTVDVALSVMSGAATALTPPRATTITYGSHLAVTTTLRNAATRAAVPGATLTLLSRTGGAGAYTTRSKTTTNAKGLASVTVTPAVNTEYEWSYTGSSAFAAATSKPATTKVAQKVTAAISATSTKRGHSVQIWGTVSPKEAGKSVALQRFRAGHWVAVGVRTTVRKVRLPHNRAKSVGFVLTYRPKMAGPEKLRVSRAGTSSNAAGGSKTLSLRVT